MALKWVQLRQKSSENRRLAIILANYPNRDGRIGNGVGLDTPLSTINLLAELKKRGYRVVDAPIDSEDLMSSLNAGPTNDFKTLVDRKISETISLADYKNFLLDLPQNLQDALFDRWGRPEDDPFYLQVFEFYQLQLRFLNLKNQILLGQHFLLSTYRIVLKVIIIQMKYLYIVVQFQLIFYQL